MTIVTDWSAARSAIVEQRGERLAADIEALLRERELLAAPGPRAAAFCLDRGWPLPEEMPAARRRIEELERLVRDVAEALLCDGHTEQITAANIVEAAASIHRGFHREIDRGCELEERLAEALDKLDELTRHAAEAKARLAAVKTLCQDDLALGESMEADLARAVLRAAEGLA